MEILHSDDTLRKEIINDAHTKAERIIKKANREKEAIISDKDKEINSIREEYSRTIIDETEKKIALLNASIDIEVKKQILAYTGEVIEDVFKMIDGELITGDQIGMKKFTLHLFKRSFNIINDSSFIIEVSKALREIVTDNEIKSVLPEKYTISSISVNDNLKEGAVVYDGNKKTAVFISDVAFLKELEFEERTKVYSILFGDVELP